MLFIFNADEKNKSIKTVNYLLNKLFAKNFNRTDLIIGMGGGITGDVASFVASIYKRGINFINVPTTLLSQVDSAIGGKTGINSSYGKNLIGSFYQPKLVISDTSFINSLPKKEMICGYAEILKHSIIKDKNFFKWLEKNSKSIIEKKSDALIYAIKKSCEIKMYFVKRDIDEKNLRMILNFGHTFHMYKKKITIQRKFHMVTVLTGMILEAKLSVLKKICSDATFDRIKNIYSKNHLERTFKKYSKQNSINKLIPYLKNDKKNNDNKINFILLKTIGKTALPNKSKISIDNLKKLSKAISEC